MSRKFWFGYMAFFVFVFPLFFSYAGGFILSPIWATIALAIGLIGWAIFIRWTYMQTIGRPRRRQRNIRSLVEDGQLRQGRVTNKSLLKKEKDGGESIEIIVEFQNLAGTTVKQFFEFTDTQPHQRRYNEGSMVNLRLSTTQQSPGIILADAQARFSWKTGLLATAFVVIYMVATFALHYTLFSNGKGWRFLSLWHPWVTTPFMGLFLFNVISIFRKFFGSNPEKEEKLLLYGKKATAIVQRADQTGTYINEQPQMKYILQFSDDAGREHVVTLKKIVPLTELHLTRNDTQDILYLPEDPEKIIFC